MEENNKAPMLLEFLFGEAAETAPAKNAGRAQRGASERLLRWVEAFDEWMAERGRKYKPSTTKQAKITWRRLLRERRESRSGICGTGLPWELGANDIEQHAAWMAAEGYAASTIYNALGIIANFYRWCDERQIDPESEAGFNPAAGVKRPKIQRYAGAKLLSKGEVEALLWILQQDDSALGKRDYAFILARVRMGVPLRALQQLQWGQIEQDEDGSPQWEMSRSGSCGINSDKLGVGIGKMPREVWEAIRAYLTASGRLAGMDEGALPHLVRDRLQWELRDDNYIFAPLAEPGKAGENNTAEDWVGERCVSTSQLLASLKLYGRLVKIPEEKLTLQALRRTAMRLRLDEGDNVEELKSFLNSKEEAKCTKYRLGKLPQLPEDRSLIEEEEFNAQVPNRQAKPFKPGEGVTHGFYRSSQPAKEVLAVLAEDIQGIEEEIAGLRRLARGLVAKQVETHSSKESAQLADAHTRAASRVAEMIEAEKKLAKDGNSDTWADEILAMMDKFAIKQGEGPVSEEVRAEALGYEPELGMFSRDLAEEIASVRYMLRNVLGLALQTQEVPDYVRLVEIYGSGCVRLVRMLKKEGSDHSRLERYLEEAIDQARREVLQEWGR